MKKLAWLMLAALLLGSMACKKQNTAVETGNPTEVTGTEDTPEAVKYVSAAVKFERGAGLYKQTGDKELVYSDSRLEQFDVVKYLGEEKKMNYEEKGKQESDKFSRCLVQMGSEEVELWIYSENLQYNSGVGVVLADCLLYNKDKLDKISDKELTMTTLVIVDSDYFNKDFYKIWAPSISTKTPYYIRKAELSLTPADIAVARLYKTAMAMGEGKEKAKGQILESAYNEYAQSAFIPLVESELLNMGLIGPGEGDGGYYDEDAGMGDEGYVEDDTDYSGEGEY